MAVVPVVLDGVLYPKGKSADDKPIVGVFIGNAAIAGLGVGGGPIIPEPGPPGSPGRPTFPIWGPPGSNFPDVPGYPPVAGHPLPIPPDLPIDPPDPGQPPGHPAHPIVIPPGPGNITDKQLVAVWVPGSAQGVVWFLLEPTEPPTEPQPKPGR